METDKYLNNNIATQRLVEAYEKFGRIIIAYDFDETIHPYHNGGDTFPLVSELLRKCRPYAKFIVYSCSPESRYPYIKEFLEANDLPYDTINENIITLNDCPKSKLYYSILLDDRAGLQSSFVTLLDFLRIIKMKEEKQNVI